MNARPPAPKTWAGLLCGFHQLIYDQLVEGDSSTCPIRLCSQFCSCRVLSKTKACNSQTTGSRDYRLVADCPKIENARTRFVRVGRSRANNSKVKPPGSVRLLLSCRGRSFTPRRQLFASSTTPTPHHGICRLVYFRPISAAC